MKKLILSMMLGGVFCSPVFAQGLQQGYLTDSSGNVVKSGFGLCWKASSSKTSDPECGDKKPESPKEPPIIISDAPIIKDEPKVDPIPPQPINLRVDTKVLFKFDSAVLSQEAKSELDKALMNNKVISAHVIGHTDSYGTEAYNEKLGLRRAQAVKDYLLSKQVAENLITIESLGESKLVVHCKPNSIACQAPNRRAEVGLDVQK